MVGGTQNNCLETQPLFLKEYLKIWMLGMELRDKRFHFEDNIGLLVLKMILLKN